MPITTRHCLTIVVLTAVGMLFVAFAAPVAADSDRSGELQSLVEDLGYQLKLVEQFDRRTAETRLQQLAIALDRWNTSSRNQQDFEVMQAWLSEATRASLPGRSKPMPKLPWFNQRLVHAESIPAPRSTTSPVTAAPSLPKAERQSSSPVVVTPEPDTTPPTVAKAWQQHPAAKPIDLGNPFSDDRGSVSDTPARSTAPHAVPSAGSVARMAMRPTTTSVLPASSKVDINVAELGARVRGYVHGLRGVEARLLASPDASGEQLFLAVRELKQLATQREFVTMYLSALSAADRNRAPELPSPEHAKAIAAARLQTLKQNSGAFDDGQAGAIEAIESMLESL